MGEGKSNSDNGNRQSKQTNQQEASNSYLKKIIADMSEQFKNIDISGSTGQKFSSSSGATEAYGTSNACDNMDVRVLADKVASINILKFELDKLPLDFKARAYFENEVKPLTDALSVLSFASSSYAITAVNIANTNFGRSSKIKDALDLAQGVDEISMEIIKVLRCKIDNMLNFSKYDCK
ncbi:hypothetical protein [Clostridium lacusfryxellense]|uniref:hypothetical protein n=1 Tax=Clostridium lacusfryxellense TaxID=205328 RepID=UPI001C0AD8EB|nr:hypothetical protein [Clostridium lacusfryxellense]MBU3111319.1 hypothetical protein [Clostridium lacusfryxellense]